LPVDEIAGEAAHQRKSLMIRVHLRMLAIAAKYSRPQWSIEQITRRRPAPIGVRE